MNISKGVSVVICCHNSASILPQTLINICRQQTSSVINWEVVIIDNKSTDNTYQISEKILIENACPVPYKILKQPELGLSYARKMGLDNSEYEYILFCDDDNWLKENYIETGFSILESDDKIGALGGESEAVTDHPVPDWFEEHKRNYSVGKQSDNQGDISNGHGVLWGAGMFVRKTALNDLYRNGFYSLLTDRKGKQLSSGGDIEKCFALRLAGWKIWYDERLKLKHYITKERLRWDYLRKLSRGFGAQKVDFDPYLHALDNSTVNISEYKWQSQAIKLFRKLRGYGLRKLITLNSSSEGDNDILRIEKTIGRLKELLKIRGDYEKRIKQIKEAEWRKLFS